MDLQGLSRNATMSSGDHSDIAGIFQTRTEQNPEHQLIKEGSNDHKTAATSLAINVINKINAFI